MGNYQEKCFEMPVSIREWAVCAFASLTLIFTAWAFGGYKTWALHLLCFGALATFFLSFLPLPLSWNGYDKRHSNLKNFERLLRQPFFWFGLLFLFYILVQYLNPSAHQVWGQKSWWVEQIDPPFGEKIPSSVRADYSNMNALRAFVIHLSAISLVCGILVGIQRRKTALLILWAFITSGTLMAFVAILQKLSETNKILWIFKTFNNDFWGTFSYRNQGAAYLILVALVIGILYFFFSKKSRIKEGKGGPHFLCFFFNFVIFSSVWLALSRSGIILGSAIALFFYLLVSIENLKKFTFQNMHTFMLIFGIFSILGTVLIWNLSDWDGIDHRYKKLKVSIAQIESYDRVLSTKATWDMACDKIIYGWGAGSFRYIFPIYQSNYEKIWYVKKHKKRGWEGRKIYNYAHNDWAQFVAEYGIAGTTLLILMFGCLMHSLGKISQISRHAAIYVAFGLIVIFAHNLIDFIFSCPAYWVAFWGSLFLIAKLYQLEKSNAMFKN